MGRVIGESFRTYVDKQIKVRQQKLGQFKRDNDIHSYLTGKSSWIRLASSIDLVEYLPILDLAQEADMPYTNKGSDLAKNYILFGGVGEVGGYNSKGGIIDSYSNNWGVNKAYGFNSNQSYGLTPMPFIEKATVTPKNRGSLRTAEISIKCFNPNQFFVIEYLYLRLGYTILLEWGHTMYFNNEGSLQTTPYNDNVHQKFLNGSYATYGPSRQDQCLEDIENTRKNSNGNYDGFLGRVQNFKWNVTPDGHYDITLNAVTYGDVIESLTINKSLTTKPEQEAKNDEDTEHASYSSTLGKILFALIDLQEEQGNRLQTTDGTLITAAEIAKIAQLDCDIFTKPSGVPLVRHELVSCEPDTIFGANKHHFIKLGTLLRIIESFLLEYDSSMNTANPILGIDYEYDNNYCYLTPGAVSTEPTICMAYSSFRYPDPTFNNPKDASPIVLAAPNVPSVVTATESNPITFEWWTNNASIFGITIPGLEKIFLKEDFLVSNSKGNTIHPQVGRHMHLHLNIDFLIKLLDDSINNQSEVNLFDFLKTICNGINKAYSGGLSLEPSYDSDTNILHIIDSNNTDKIQKLLGQPLSSPTKINVGLLKQGEGSFVTETSITSELSNKFASQIAIGAQNNNNNIGSNSFFFSKWNSGLEDRIVKKKETNSKLPPVSAEQKQAQTEKLQQSLIAFLLITGAFFDEIKSEHEQLKSFMKERTDQASKEYNSVKGFIPINLSLTLDGIAGPRIFEKYTITEDFLPSSYRNNIEFIIKGLTHTIDTNGWVTKIEGLSMPKER